ncbi:hypothetical protein HID58_052085, partial [Brassica napus]
CDSINVDLIPLVPSGEGGYVGCGSSISGVQAKQMGEMVSVSGVLRRNYRWFRLRRRCLLGAGRGGVTR